MALHALEIVGSTVSSWAEVDLEPVLDGPLDEDPPVYFPRTDGVPLLYKGKVSASPVNRKREGIRSACAPLPAEVSHKVTTSST